MLATVLDKFLPASPERLTGLAPALVERRVRLFAVLAALCISATYLLLINRFWHFSSDSGLYLALARSLREGHGYAFAGFPYGKAPPGWPFILSLLMAVSGEFLWLNVVQCLAMLAALAVLYLALRQVADGATALLVLFLTAMLFWSHEYAVALMSETPFFLFSNLALLSLLTLLNTRTERYRALLLAGICAAWTMAFWCRLLACFWLGPFVFALLFGSRRTRPVRHRLLGAAFVAAVVVLSLLIYMQWASKMAQAASQAPGAVAQAAGGAPPRVRYLPPATDTHSVVRAVLRLPRWFLLVLCPPWEGVLRPVLPGPAIAVGHLACTAVVLLGAAAVLRRGQALAGGSLLFFLPFVLSAPGYKVTTGRYAIAVAPFVVLLFLTGLATIGEFAQKRLHRRLTKRLLVNAGIAFILLPNGLLLAGDIWIQRRPDFYAAYRGGAYAQLMGMARWLERAQVRELVASSDATSRRTVATLTHAPVVRLPKRALGARPPAADRAKQYARDYGARYIITLDRSQPWPTWHIPKHYLGGGVPNAPYWQLYEYDAAQDALRPIEALPERRWPTRIPIERRIPARAPPGPARTP